MKKIFYFILIFFLLLQFANGQSLTPFVVSTSGAFYSNSAGMLSSTIGEMTMVQTFIGTNNFLTQGFQQPRDTDLITAVTPLEVSNTAVSVYPNPAFDQLFLNIISEQGATFYFRIIDVIGKEISTPASTNGATHIMDVSNIVNGIYLLNIETPDKKFNHTVRFIKN